MLYFFHMSINFNWDKPKNKTLTEGRGVCFEDVVSTIYEDKVLDNIKHPNQQKYPNQFMYIIRIMGYVYVVPYIKNDNEIFFKTIIPSRKMHKLYEDKL